MTSSAQLVEAINHAASMQLPFVSINTLSLSRDTSLFLPIHHSVLLVKREDVIVIGISNPTLYIAALSYWQKQTTLNILCVWVNEKERSSLIDKQCKRHWELILKTNAWKNHIPNLALFCCLHADQKRATDLQLLTQEKYEGLTLRIDGIRETLFSLPLGAGKRLMRHWMLESKLDNSQRMKPQDGNLVIHHNRNYRFRVNVCPTDKGRSLALRLPRQRESYSLESLLFEEEQETIIRNILNQKQGLLIITGPTGSGKTESLYCCLQYLVHQLLHIITLEDPVEYQLRGVTQIPVRGLGGLSYHDAVKNSLRQDPDVIMIGEIRDEETARIALEAAQTGHLVLASCHINHTLATCQRLKQLKLSLSDLTDIKTVILAQRLIRTRCLYCQDTHIHECLHCNQGYRGRRAVFECLSLSLTLLNAFHKKSDQLTLKSIAESEGTLWMHEHAKRLIDKGITTESECLRILGDLFTNRWEKKHG